MILVWSGWGVLAVLIPVLAGLLGTALAKAVGMERPDVLAGLFVALSGIGVWRLGLYLNRDRVAGRLATFRSTREAELSHLVENGAYLSPDGTRPTSLAQARAEASARLDAETRHVGSRMARGSSLFWVPMQYCGYAVVVIGAFIALTAFTRGG